MPFINCQAIHMSTSSLQAFVATAVKAARRAAREITRAANDRDLLRIEDKSANDFVTSAARAAEEKARAEAAAKEAETK